MKNKKAWIRIFEAFLAILLIFGVLILFFSRQISNQNTTEEIIRVQKAILDSILSDEKIRYDILHNNISSIENFIAPLVPQTLNFSVSVCSYNLVCGLNSTVISSEMLASREIYSSEALVLSDLDTFGNKKIKLFFWRI